MGWWDTGYPHCSCSQNKLLLELGCSQPSGAAQENMPSLIIRTEPTGHVWAVTLQKPSSALPHMPAFSRQPPGPGWMWDAMLEHVTEARAAVMRIIVSPPRERAASVPACVRTAPNEAAARRGLCTKILPAYEHRSKLQLHSHIGMMESMPSHGRSGSVSPWDC